jgi:hypothetical protein
MGIEKEKNLSNFILLAGRGAEYYEATIKSIDQYGQDILKPPSLIQLEDEARSKALCPNSFQKTAIEYAKEGIAQLCRLRGVWVDNPEVILLTKRNYEKWEERNGEKSGGTGGMTFYYGGPVVVLADDAPNYFLSARIFHELIHKYLEKKVALLNLDVDLSNKTMGVDLEGRRWGLSVEKVNSSPTENGVMLDGTDFAYGNLLNEIGVCLVEKYYLDQILQERPAFQAELIERERQIKALSLNKIAENLYEVSLFAASDPVLFDKSNIHFVEKDISLFKNSEILFLQLANDLRILCAGHGIDIMEVMLKAKENPRQQNIVRDILNKEMYPGFFEKVKRTESNERNILELLLDVQTKLYWTED